MQSVHQSAMRFQTTLIFCIALATELVFGEVWEFGENVPTSILFSHNQGDISLLEKTRNIHLIVSTHYNKRN